MFRRPDDDARRSPRPRQAPASTSTSSAPSRPDFYVPGRHRVHLSRSSVEVHHQIGRDEAWPTCPPTTESSQFVWQRPSRSNSATTGCSNSLPRASVNGCSSTMPAASRAPLRPSSGASPTGNVVPEQHVFQTAHPSRDPEHPVDYARPRADGPVPLQGGRMDGASRSTVDSSTRRSRSSTCSLSADGLLASLPPLSSSRVRCASLDQDYYLRTYGETYAQGSAARPWGARRNILRAPAARRPDSEGRPDGSLHRSHRNRPSPLAGASRRDVTVRPPHARIRPSAASTER